MSSDQISDLDIGPFPRFRVITGVLNATDDARELYEHVMHDVHVERTGRFEVVTEPKMSTDKTGILSVVMEVVDNGPRRNLAERW